MNCSGKPGFNAPKWSAGGGIEQVAELGDYRLIGTIDGRYRSNRVIGFEYLPQQNSGSDFTADASLTLTDAAERWSVTAWVRNLTDNVVPVIAQFAGSTGNQLTTGYTPPRTYGLRARTSF